MVLLIIQARMGSTRLPGKVLRPILGRPMLSFEIERLKRAKRIDQIVVATSERPLDDAIARFCSEEGVACTRGPEEDVLERFFITASAYPASVIVRVTADCPLIDPSLIDEAVEKFLEQPQRYDYVSNMIKPSWPYGLAVEVMSAEALFEANAEAMESAEREHVTPFIYWRPRRYRIGSMTREPDLSHHRWTVDTEEDFALVSLIIEALYPKRPCFDMADVLSILDQNPLWLQINAHVRQKVVKGS